MGETSSRVVVEREMTDISEFKCNTTKRNPEMYPTSLDDVGVLTGKIDSFYQSYAMKPESDDQTRAITNEESLSIDSDSISSHEFPHYSQGVDVLTILNKSPSRLQSTPKYNSNQVCEFNNGDKFNVHCNGNHGVSETMETTRTSDMKSCNCEGDQSSNCTCEVIVTTHECVVSKTLRQSCSLSDDALLPSKAGHKPKWKIEVDMESTRVLHGAGALERDPNDSFVSETTTYGDSKIYMKDESTGTDEFEQFMYESWLFENNIGRHDEHFLTVTSSDINVDDEQKKKKNTFWTRRKNRKHSHDKGKSKNVSSSEDGGTLKHRALWPFGKLSNNAKQNLLKQSMLEEKLKYLHIAARVNCPRVAEVRATLLVETPSAKLTNAQLSTKTYLLSVTLTAFFYPYPKIYVEWVDSLSDIIAERMTSGDITPKFGTSDVTHCKLCLILSRDASVLLYKPNCAIIMDLANIAGYSQGDTFVMEATDDRRNQINSKLTCNNMTSAIAPTAEKFPPIYETEECEDEMLNVNCSNAKTP